MPYGLMDAKNESSAGCLLDFHGRRHHYHLHDIMKSLLAPLYLR